MLLVANAPRAQIPPLGLTNQTTGPVGNERRHRADSLAETNQRFTGARSADDIREFARPGFASKQRAYLLLGDEVAFATAKRQLLGKPRDRYARGVAPMGKGCDALM